MNWTCEKCELGVLHMDTMYCDYYYVCCDATNILYKGFEQKNQWKMLSISRPFAYLFRPSDDLLVQNIIFKTQHIVAFYPPTSPSNHANGCMRMRAPPQIAMTFSFEGIYIFHYIFL